MTYSDDILLVPAPLAFTIPPGPTNPALGSVTMLYGAFGMV